MANEFRLPDIGEGLAEATIITWYVGVGDEVGLDEPLVELETDKAVVDVPSPYAGVVLYHGGEAGDVVAVDSVLAVVGGAGEEWVPAAAEAQSVDAAPIVGTLDEPPAGAVAAGSAVQALPAVRRLAGELGVDMTAVTGSGAGGRVTADDVRAAAGRSAGPVERVRMTATRRAIAQHLTQAWREIPHVTTYGEADGAALLAQRATAGGTTLEALLISRVAPLLVDHPAFNAGISGDDILYKKHYDVGFAVDTAAGLLVAVIRNVLDKDVDQLDADVRRLAAAAKDHKLTADEVRGQTFTISNIGAVGGRYGTPIIPLGTSAILSVGRAAEQAVVRDGAVAVARQFPLSLSYDHRIIDGAAGRAFMTAVISAIAD